MKKLVLNISVAIFIPIVILGSIELGIRGLYHEKLNTYFDSQVELVLGNPPKPKTAGEYRIAIFGDSAAYGFPVADRYSITAWLRKSFPYLIAGKTVNVFNCAWPGKSSHQVLQGAK